MHDFSVSSLATSFGGRIQTRLNTVYIVSCASTRPLLMIHPSCMIHLYRTPHPLAPNLHLPCSGDLGQAPAQHFEWRRAHSLSFSPAFFSPYTFISLYTCTALPGSSPAGGSWCPEGSITTQWQPNAPNECTHIIDNGTQQVCPQLVKSFQQLA